MAATSFTMQKALYLLVRVSLGLTFLWASWGKIRHPAEFASLLMNYDILPVAAVNMMALILPWIELICGLSLLGGRFVSGAVLTISVLLFIFLLAAGFNLYRGLDVDCGCFSVSPDVQGSSVLNLVRNCLLLAASLWLYFFNSGKSGREHGQPPDRVIKNAG